MSFPRALSGIWCSEHLPDGTFVDDTLLYLIYEWGWALVKGDMKDGRLSQGDRSRSEDRLDLADKLV